MHELAVTQSLLDIVQRHAAQAGAVRVTALHIVVGQLSSIVDDSVQFYWSTLCQGTPCEGAQLHFERVAAQLVCRDCGTVYTLDGGLAACPRCGRSRVRVTAGDEFSLESIEIETASDLAKASV